MPATTQVHPSLVRPPLVAGVEHRILVLEGTLVAVLLLGVGIHAPTVIAALLVVFVVHPFLVRLSKEDPQALTTYVRSLRYQPYYQRASHPSAPVTVYRPFTSGTL